MVSVYMNSSENVTVSYPMREATQTLTKADYYAVRCIGESNKIRAIKFVRMATGLGLYESKQIVDTVMEHRDVLPDWAPPGNLQNPPSLGALLREKLGASCDTDND